MNTIYVLQNEFGVKVNIRANTPTISVQGVPVIETPWLYTNSLPMYSDAFIGRSNLSISTLLVNKTKGFFMYILSLPALVSKKILKFFEENPYSYPTYPFHFPILIYSDPDLFSHPDYWDAFDQKQGLEQDKKEDAMKLEQQGEQHQLSERVAEDKIVA